MIVADEWLSFSSNVVFFGHLILLLLIPGWLIFKGRVFTAGIVALVCALLPFFWQVNFTNSGAKGAVLLMLFTVPLSCVVLLAGSGLLVARGWRRIFQRD